MSKEYPCIYHENGKCKKYSGDGVTSYCVLGPCHDETPSNADRIRAMSDEEFAGMFLHVVVHGCPPGESRKDCPRHYGEKITCYECWLKWLLQPAEGGEQDATD